MGERLAMRLQWIQILRAVAASAIVVHHCIYYAVRRAGLDDGDASTSILAAGVDLFFVISGFIMMMVSDPEHGREQAPGRFVAKRITRIVPIYWFYTAIIIAVGVAAPAIFRSTHVDVESALLSLFFIPYTSGPLLRVGWTLNYEMWFYAAFAVVLISRAGLWGRVAAMALIFGALYVIGCIAGRHGPVTTFVGYTITFEFVMGMAIYALVRSYGRLGTVQAAAVILLGATVFGWSIARGNPTLDDRFFFWGVPAAAIVYAALSMPEVKGGLGRLLELLGDASYSIYLSHMLTIGALHAISSRFLPMEPWLFIAVAFVVSLAVGLASYRVVERPLLQLARGRVRIVQQRPT